jgi:aryl-alcohol dehydrogenase-like predicted oxidoreductase
VSAAVTNSYARLGRTDLQVCPIGIGCGIGIRSADVEYAIERGINYFFWSSDLHPATYSPARAALSKYVRRGSKRRDRVVLAACSYLCDPEKIFAVVADQLVALKLDHLDVFFWGWVTQRSDPARLVEETRRIVCDADARKTIDEFFAVQRQVADELRCRGYARYLGVSTHDKPIAAQLAAHDDVDVVMVRYNIAHRNVEKQVFDTLPSANRPGIVAFNTTHNASGTLASRPPGIAEQYYRPTHADLYRFALARPEVDVVLTGPRTRDEIDHSLTALDNPLDPKLYEYLRKMGDLHMGRVKLVAVSA